MIFNKHKFVRGNFEDHPSDIKPDEVIMMENLRYGTTDDGTASVLHGIKGTLERMGGVAVVENEITIGARGDASGRFIVYMNYSPLGQHRIILFDAATNTNWLVSQDDRWNFSKDHLIHSIAIVDGICYFTDDYNEPRGINLGALIKANNGGASPIPADWSWSIEDFFTTHIIKRPPAFAPVVERVADSAYASTMMATNPYRFAHQFVYWDGETSVLSPYSTSTRFNLPNESYNAAKVTLKQDGTVDCNIWDAVRKVRVIAIDSITGDAFVAREWDKNNVEDFFAIQAHNNNVTPLSFTFHTHMQGESISNADKALNFHTVPLRSGTLEVIKNRLFLGDNEEGYDAPATTSLTVEATLIENPAAISVMNGVEVKIIRAWRRGLTSASEGLNYSAYVVNITGFSLNGLYLIKSTAKKDETPPIEPVTLDPLGATVAFSDLEYIGANDWPSFLTWWYTKFPNWDSLPHAIDVLQVDFTALTIDITGATSVVQPMLKSLDTRKHGMMFLDKGLRRCSVVTKDSLVVKTAVRNFTLTHIGGQYNWALSNTAAVDEIPDWAHFYIPLQTKSLRTRFFVSGLAATIKYASPDATTPEDMGKWTDAADVYASGCIGISIPIESLGAYGLGYVPTEGDSCLLLAEDGSYHDLAVLRLNTAGTRVLLNPKDIGSVATKKFIFELYRPYKSSGNEPFFEMGQVYKVTAPNSGARQYSVLAGSFAPDCYAVSRNYLTNSYLAEAMNPNDRYFERWESDHGKANYYTTLGQKRNQTSVKYSGTYIAGTDTNGLSDFQPLNEEILPLEMGAVERLISANRAQTDGTVLLAIGQAKTVSIYIGEGVLSTASGSQFLVRTDGVIGQVNPMAGDMGTLHPESVGYREGRIFWVDALQRQYCSYSGNGLFPISNYKFSRGAKMMMDKLLSLSAAEIEALGSRPFVVGGCDGYHGEYLFAMPKLSADPLHDAVEDVALPYPFDVVDYQAGVIVFKIDGDTFHGKHVYEPEMFCELGDKLFSFKNGRLYEHGVGAHGEFYGNRVPARVMIVENFQQDEMIKKFKALVLNANRTPRYTLILTKDPYTQVSDLVNTDWSSDEGVLYASILRDRLSPNLVGSGDVRLLKGDVMMGKYALIMLEFDVLQPVEIRDVTVGLTISGGHTAPKTP